MTRILFFGALRDAAGCAEMQCDAALADVAAVRAWLASRDPRLGDALHAPGIRVAVDQRFAGFDTPLRTPREIAFMSPLSGG
jgi:molybdopterin converting factor small subunit